MFKSVKYMFGAALIATTGFLAQDVALAGGGFSASCLQEDVNFVNKHLYLTAKCFNKNHSLVDNRLQLDDHIANDDGHLVWRKNGGFSASVVGCGLKGEANNILSCLAAQRNGFDQFTDINLDDEIANYDGHLTVLDGF